MAKLSTTTNAKQHATSEFYSLELMGALIGLCWSTSGGKLAVWLKDGTTVIFGNNGEKLHSWKAHETQISKVSWSFKSDLIATTGRDGLCKIWTDDGISVACIEQKEGWVDHVKWSSWANLLLTGCGKHLRLWSQSGSLVDELVGHQWPVTDASWFANHGDLLASCAADGICLWRAGVSEPLCRLQLKGYPERLSLNNAGTHLAFSCSDNSINVWVLDTGTVVKMAGYGGQNSIEWNWGGQWLAFCSDFEGYIWKFNEHFPRSSLSNELVGAFAKREKMRFHSYEHLLACGNDDGSVYVWRTDVSSRSMPIAVSKNDSAVIDLSWNPFARKLAIAHQNGEVRIWTSKFEGNSCF